MADHASSTPAPTRPQMPLAGAFEPDTCATAARQPETPANRVAKLATRSSSGKLCHLIGQDRSNPQEGVVATTPTIEDIHTDQHHHSDGFGCPRHCGAVPQSQQLTDCRSLPRPADLLAILDAGPISPDDLAALSKSRRRSAQHGIDALIAYLDAADADPDLEPTGDENEPTLGAPEVEYKLNGIPQRCGHVDQRRWADGGNDEDGEREPTLGSPLGGGDLWNRHAWSAGYQRNSAHDECEDVSEDEGSDTPFDMEPDEEPTLGAREGHIDQRRWAGDDTMGCSQDEPSLGAPENPHDQRRWSQGRKGSVELDHDERQNLSTYGVDQYETAQRIRRETRALLQSRRLVPERRVRLIPEELIAPEWRHLPRCS